MVSEENRRRQESALSAPDVRALSWISGTGRLAIAAGLALAPRKALAALGFEDHSSATVVVARIAGARDAVLGAATLLALNDPARLRAASLANAVADAGDAATFGAAATGDRDLRAAALRGVAAAAPAALAGLWVAWRVRP